MFCTCKSAVGEVVKTRFIKAHGQLHAPHVTDLEIAQTLRQLVSSRRLSAQRADEALADFEAVALIRHPHRLFLWRIWQLRHALTAYDAA